VEEMADWWRDQRDNSLIPEKHERDTAKSVYVQVIVTRQPLL
jgi:hypothetical protein